MSTAKDAFFFFHDANARSDHKIIKLLRIHGPAGYGCYWMLIESLRDTSDLTLPIQAVPDLAYNFRVDEALISSIINSFELFIIDGDMFYSARLKRSLQNYFAKKEKLSAAGIRGNEKRWGTSPPDSNAITTQSPPDSNAITTQSLKEEKRREEKRIDNIIAVPNTLAFDVIRFLNEKANKNYSVKTSKTIQFIKARVNDGYGIDDFKKVIEIKASQWLNDPVNDKFLRPETLFGNKFEGYLNEQIIIQTKQRGLVC